MTAEKRLHTVVLDAGPIIKGDPSISTLRAQSEQLVTLPSVIQEIRDEATRARLQTSLLPFLVLKSPKESSVKVISDFARRTGDLSVLSRVDVQLLALAYDLECERNGGDWRLRKAPGEKRINGANPNAKTTTEAPESTAGEKDATTSSGAPKVDVATAEKDAEKTVDEQVGAATELGASQDPIAQEVSTLEGNHTIESSNEDAIVAQVDALDLLDVSKEEDTSDSDSEGWITPSNLKKKQEEDLTGNTNAVPEPKVLQVVSSLSMFHENHTSNPQLGSSHIRLCDAERCSADESQPLVTITATRQTT